MYKKQKIDTVLSNSLKIKKYNLRLFVYTYVKM